MGRGKGEKKRALEFAQTSEEPIHKKPKPSSSSSAPGQPTLMDLMDPTPEMPTPKPKPKPKPKTRKKKGVSAGPKQPKLTSFIVCASRSTSESELESESEPDPESPPKSKSKSKSKSTARGVASSPVVVADESPAVIVIPTSPAPFFLTPAERAAKRAKARAQEMKDLIARQKRDAAALNSAFGPVKRDLTDLFSVAARSGGGGPHGSGMGHRAVYSTAELDALPRAPWPSAECQHVRALSLDLSAQLDAIDSLEAAAALETLSVSDAVAYQESLLSSLRREEGRRQDLIPIGPRVVDLEKRRSSPSSSFSCPLDPCVPLVATLEGMCEEHGLSGAELSSFIDVYTEAARGAAPGAQWVDVFTLGSVGAALAKQTVDSMIESWLLDWANLKRRSRKQKKTRRAQKRREREKLFGMATSRFGSPRRGASNEWSHEDADEEEKQAAKLTTSDLLALAGPVGSGKTQVVYSLAARLGYRVLEVGPGEVRSGARIMSRFGEATVSRSMFDGKEERDAQKAKDAEMLKTILLFEDVDVLFEEDRGFWNALSSLVSQSKQPIVLTCNQIPAELESLSVSCHILEMEAFQVPSISLHLQIIALTAGVFIPREDLDKLIEHRACDVRSSIQLLQFWAQHRVCMCVDEDDHVVLFRVWEAMEAGRERDECGSLSVPYVADLYPELASSQHGGAGEKGVLETMAGLADAVSRHYVRPAVAVAVDYRLELYGTLMDNMVLSSYVERLVPSSLLEAGALAVRMAETLRVRDVVESEAYGRWRSLKDLGVATICSPIHRVCTEAYAEEVFAFFVLMCRCEQVRRDARVKRRFRHHFRDAGVPFRLIDELSHPAQLRYRPPEA